MSKRNRLWLVLAVLVVFGCRSGFGAVTIVYDEPFQSACDGVPCGWTQVRGESGQARFAEIGVFGDHGLVLRGSGVTVQGPAVAEPVLSTVPLGGIRLVLEARCDVGNSLGISVAVRDPDLGTLNEYSTRVSPGDLTLTRASALITRPAVGADAGAFDPIGGPERFLQVVGISIEKTGDSVCEVGSLQLQDAGDAAPEPEGC